MSRTLIQRLGLAVVLATLCAAGVAVQRYTDPLAAAAAKGGAPSPSPDESLWRSPAPYVSPTPARGNVRARLAAASDYWVLAHDLLPEAQSGDADAQFYLSRVLSRCDDGVRMYLQRRGQNLAPDQVIQWAASRHLSIDLAQLMFDRCEPFTRHDAAELGTEAEWLARATAAGQPVAQAETALRILVQRSLHDYAETNGLPPVELRQPVLRETDPGELVRSAVRSGDPEALILIGEFAGAMTAADPEAPLADLVVVRLSWMLLACQRGLDCSPGADWIRVACYLDNTPNCGSIADSSDFVRHLAGDDWPTVQERTQQLGAALDAGQWDQLGLGP
jgi:hypothetical protein